MKLWELIKVCSEGGYVEGDKFKDEKGFIAYFNGDYLIYENYFLKKQKFDSEWEYLNKEVK